MRQMLSILPAVTMLALQAGAGQAPFETQAPSFPVVKIAAAIPPGFVAQAGSELSLANVSMSDTGHSLRFAWDKPGASFTLTNPEAFTHITGERPAPCVYEWITCTTVSAFSVWVFNETPHKARLWFEIGTRDRVDCRFYMNLDFTGWRELKALYGRDIGDCPKPGADTLRIIAPAELAKGSLCFDLFNPRLERDVRNMKATPETPWVFNQKAAASGGGTCVEAKLEDQTPMPERVDIPTPASLDSAQLAALRELTDKYMRQCNVYAPDTKRELGAQELAALRERYAKHHFARAGKALSGEVIHPRVIWPLIGDLATAWKASSREDTREELLQMAFDLVDLVALYGHTWWYGVGNGFVRPLQLLRGELVATGRWEPVVAQLKRSYGADAFDLKDLGGNGNADSFNCALSGQVGALLLQDDTPRKWRDLMALRRYLDTACVEQGCVMPDGTIMHHNMNYSGYNVPAISALCWATQLLSGSPFEANAAHRAIRRAALAMRFYSCSTIPDFFNGRHRGGGEVGFPVESLRLLAEAGNPATGEAVDREMAALYLWFNLPNEASKRFRALGVEPVQPSGNLTLPFSVASFQRRGDWMVGVKGQKKFVGANEAYAISGNNTMGRYCNFGNLVIQSRREASGKPVSGKGSGFEPDKGWDFNHWPGTTARILPYEALRCHFSVLEAMTTEGFAGGTSLDGDGLFAMKLQEDVPGAATGYRRVGPTPWWLGEKEYQRRVKDSAYDPDFRARKSWFFFDDHVICLGSGITGADDRFPVATTLFQNSLSLPGRKERFSSDAPAAAPFPLDTTTTTGRWLLDSCDNGYWLPPGNNPLHVLRARRSLPYYAKWTLDAAKMDPSLASENDKPHPNEGDMELAWLDHGAAPKAVGYEYAILVDTTAKKLAAFAAKPPYRVLEKDALAHVVWDRASNSTGYAVFDAAWEPDKASRLRSVSRPCLVMSRELADGQLRLSFADPDLGLDPSLDPNVLYAGSEVNFKHRNYAGGTNTRVVLNGVWKLVGAPTLAHIVEGSAKETTVVEFHCEMGQPVVIELKAGTP